jgi:hypothetical protein
MKLRKIAVINVIAACFVLSAGAVLFSANPVSAGSGGEENRQVDVCSDPGECEAVNGFIKEYINPAIRVLTALVGITAVLSIVIAGIQYAGSADDPGVVTKAKQRIFNVVLALVVYAFLVAFLNYLIPGGIW